MSERIGNANLEHRCARCGRRFPRMYQEDDRVVCNPRTCRTSPRITLADLLAIQASTWEEGADDATWHADKDNPYLDDKK